MKRSNEDTRSSQIFFTARVKNKREDTKLKYEMKQIEREFGHTIFSIHKDIRDLKAELKITKRSSGHSSEGWFAGDDDNALSMTNDRSRPTKSAGGERRRKNALGHLRHQKRVSSAPASGNSRDMKTEHRLTETPERHGHVREIDQRVSNSKSEERQAPKGKAMITQKHGMRTLATRLVPVERDGTVNGMQHIDYKTFKLNPSETQSQIHEDNVNAAKGIELSENNRSKIVKKNSYLNPTVTLNLDGQDRINMDLNNGQPLRPDDAVERPLSPAMTKFVKDRWLKPSLKTKTNDKNNFVDKPKKTVRISSHTSHYQENNTSDMTLPSTTKNMKTLLPKKIMKTAAFMTQPPSPSADPPPPTNLWASVSSKVMGNSNDELVKKSVNVIPDVRKRVMSVDEMKMKRKRDNLLASSVSALLAGKTSRRKNADGSSESGKGEESEGTRISPVSGAENDQSPSPNPRRRFSFGTIAMLAVNQHRAFPVEKKATLGSRLRLKTPAEESHQRNIDIRKSVLVDDSDSDDDHKSNYTAPAKPKIDLKNVKSKISNQWNQDAALEKPPTLADDTFQLQRSLAAAHISRGRDLRDMQDGNEVDPMKVIEEDRQSALMIKFKAFNKLLSGGNDKKENRRKSVMDAIHAGTDGKQILKLMRLANQN